MGPGLSGETWKDEIRRLRSQLQTQGSAFEKLKEQILAEKEKGNIIDVGQPLFDFNKETADTGFISI